MNLSKLVFYNTAVQIIAKIITLVFGITTTILLTNYLGSGGYGEYVFSLSFVAIFSGLSDFGTALIAVKQASQKEDKADKILGNVILLRIIFSLFITLASWLIILFFPFSDSTGKLRALVFLSSALILIFSLKNSTEIIFQAKLKLDRLALVELAASFFTFIFTILVVKFMGNIFFLINGVILANLLASAAGFVLVGKLIFLDFSPSRQIFKNLIFESIPMGGVLVVYSIYNRLDSLVLEVFKGSQSVGIYGLSYRVYEVLILGAFYFMNSLFPIIAREKNKGKLVILYQRIFDILALSGLSIFLGTFIFAPLAIKIIAFKKFGEFGLSTPLLRILGLATIFSFLNHLTGYTIIALGKQKQYLICGFIALVFNGITNLLLVPHFSFFASAWITVLTEALVFSLTSLVVFRSLDFLPNPFLFPKTAIKFIKTKGRIFEN